MPLYLVEAPTVAVVSLADAKAHLRVEDDDTDDDDLIDALVKAATQALDGRDGCLQRALMSQTWDLKLECWPYYFSRHSHRDYRRWNAICLPLPPLLGVEFIKYIDANGVEQTFGSDSPNASYHVAGIGAGQGGRIQLRDGVSWPAVASSWPEPITVRFRAGYVDTSNSPATGEVDARVIQAIKLIVGHLYANRETVVVGVSAVEIPYTADWLLKDLKFYG